MFKIAMFKLVRSLLLPLLSTTLSIGNLWAAEPGRTGDAVNDKKGREQRVMRAIERSQPILQDIASRGRFSGTTVRVAPVRTSENGTVATSTIFSAAANLRGVTTGLAQIAMSGKQGTDRFSGLEAKSEIGRSLRDLLALNGTFTLTASQFGMPAIAVMTPNMVHPGTPDDAQAAVDAYGNEITNIKAIARELELMQN